ncbi:MAG: hypothetical protein MJ208_01595 [Bacilli bacterium]|nr:hypothetical protein [Bacilli bacterium]
MKKIGFIALPLLAVSFLTNCNKSFAAPGREIDVVEASKWASDHFVKRTNLAKSATTHVGLDNFSCDGMLYPAIFIDPVPIDAPTYINLKVNNNDFTETTYTNLNGVVGAFITKNGYREDPEIGKGNFDYIMNYLLNPFIEGEEINYIELLKLATKENAFVTRYTLDGENLYATYHFNDLANVSEVIKALSIQEPKRTFALPFTGTGSVSLMLGFDSQGYPIEMQAMIDSDNLDFHFGLTGGQINTTFFTGAMHGKVEIKNKVTLYEENEYAHINFRELNKDGSVKDSITYKPRCVKDQNEAHDVGTDYNETIGVDLKDYYETLLPGYGTNVVILGHTLANDTKVYVNYNGASYPIDDSTAACVQAKDNGTDILIHFYPESFNLFKGNVSIDIYLGGN